MTHKLEISRILVVFIALLSASLACSLTNEENLEGGGKLVVDERPALVLLAPANQNDYEAGTTVVFHAMARDVGAGVARIEFTINLPGDSVQLIETAENPQGQAMLEAMVEWTAIGNQTYLIDAVAYRADGTPSNAEQISIKIYDPNPPANIPPDSVDTGDDMSTTGDDSMPDDMADPVNIAVDLPDSFTGTIIGGDSPVRQGAGTSFQTVITYNEGEIVEIVGRSADTLWLVIRVGEGFGWLFAPSVQTEVDINTLPLVDSPAQE